MSETIHFVGVGGVGMSGLARIVAAQGGAATGSDARDSETLEALRAEGVRAVAGHHADNVAGATLVVVSAAVKKDNPEVVAARSLGIPVISRAQMLGRLMDGYKRSIAVTGTHGKTTTTGMIAMVLEAAGLDATVLIGGDLPAYGGNARLGKSDIFLTEACEAYDSFLELNPRYAVVTNIEADHLDYYGDLSNVLRSFRRFLTQVKDKAVVCGYDENIRTMLLDTTGLPETLNYGLYENVSVRATDVSLEGLNPSYAVHYKGQRLGVVTLSVPGIHNVANSLAAVTASLQMGIAFEDIAAGLASFTGTGRRFERLGETPAGVLVIDDYAHHPTEIRATLAAARKGYPNRRVVAVFQPHLPSRTNDFKEEFAESFRDADHVFLTDIYLAREQPIEGVTGAGLAALTADRRGAAHVTYVADKAMIPARLGEYTAPGDVVIALGAGHDVRAVAEAFVAQGAPIAANARGAAKLAVAH